jgi:hypothetical protein
VEPRCRYCQANKAGRSSVASPVCTRDRREKVYFKKDTQTLFLRKSVDIAKKHGEKFPLFKEKIIELVQIIQIGGAALDLHASGLWLSIHTAIGENLYSVGITGLVRYVKLEEAT